jgi:hypothetical protein
MSRYLFIYLLYSGCYDLIKGWEIKMEKSSIIRNTKDVMRNLRGRVEIEVPHLDASRTFVHPSFNEGSYSDLNIDVEQKHLCLPSMGEMASLLDRAFDRKDLNYDSPELKGVRDRVRRRGVSTSTVTLWTTERGYVEDNPELKYDSRINKYVPKMVPEDLKSRFEKDDPSVRLISYFPTYKKFTDVMGGPISRNQYVVALAGREGAEKLERVSKSHNAKGVSYHWIFTNNINNGGKSFPHSEINHCYLGFGLLSSIHFSVCSTRSSYEVLPGTFGVVRD